MIAPTPTEREELRKSLDKILVEAAIALPFEQAIQLSKSSRCELEVVLREMFLAKDLARLAAKWEPKRKLDAGFKETLREDLIDLLEGRRPPFTGSVTLDLNTARQQLARSRLYIERSLPIADAKKLLKAWANPKPAPKQRSDVIDQLLAVLTQDHPASKVA